MMRHSGNRCFAKVHRYYVIQMHPYPENIKKNGLKTISGTPIFT